MIEATWIEIERHLEQSTAIVVPIGSVEQHGPLGLLGTDAMCAEAVAVRAGEIGGFLVAPTLPIGMAQHHLAFPGTISLTPATLISVVKDVVASLDRAGFRRILFLNGHGGNTAAVTSAFERIVSAQPPEDKATRLRLGLRNWFDLPGMRDLLKEMYPQGHGSHATPSEIAITQHLLPHAIKEATLDPPIAPDGRFADAEDFRRRYPDGRKGANSSLASPEDGARILEAAARALAEEFARFAEAV